MLSQRGGIVLYLRQEGRGIGLYNKIDAYALQETGLDTYEANRVLGHDDDEREYRVAAEMLLALRVRSIDLLTNNPDKALQLRAHGIEVRREISTGLYVSAHNLTYIADKIQHSGHRLVLTPTSDHG